MIVSKKILKKIIEENYGDVVKKHGDEWIIPSFFNPAKMKCYVNVEKGTAIDFISGKGYSSESLIKEIMGFNTYEEVREFVLEYSMRYFKSVSLDDGFKRKQIKQPQPPPPSRIELPESINLLGDSMLAKKVRNYLMRRNIDKNDIEKYRLGYAIKGKYAGRIIIPFIEDNEIIWFQARATFDTIKKYDNPPEIKKSSVVYNIDAIKDEAIIVEGPFDAMMVDGQAIMGSTLSEWQAYKIINKKPKRVIVVPDNDYNPKLGKSPGYVGALRSIEQLVEMEYPLESIFVARVRDGKDLNELGKKQAKEIINTASPFSFKTIVEFRNFGAVSKKLERLV